MVREADGPDYTRLSLQPWVYSFSNGRLFIDTLPAYTPFDIVPYDFTLESGSGVLLLESGSALIQEDAS